jgi:hypothetical protein
MKFGIALPYWDALKTGRYARLVEENGWDGVFVGDAIWCEDPIISLTVAALQTNRIHLGVMVIPMPLRKPWKIASETAALDHVSGGRLILGLGTGAVFMGWHAFPDEVTETKARAEMLDEGIDILTGMFLGKPFDFEGKHFHVKLTTLDEQYYPPRPIQQPRIPLWIPGVWPRMKSMRRVLKCDGLLAQKMDASGQFVNVYPRDVGEMKAYIDANRTLTNPFDIIIEEQSLEWSTSQTQDKLGQWQEAGATWWVEGLWGTDEQQVQKRIEMGPPM